VVTEVQLMLNENAKAKQKMHAVYKVMRGDFSAADVDLQVLAKKRTTLALALAPDMRTLQQEARRELSTGAMTVAVLLSYFDLGTTVAVGFTYLRIGTPSGTRGAYTTFGMLIGSLMLQAVMNWATGQGVVAAVVTLFGGKPVFDAYNVIHEMPMRDGQNPIQVLTLTRVYEVCFDALPQAVMQATILVQLADDERDLLLWGSIVFSALSVSYLVAMMEVDVDTDLHYRSAFERIHGYMPKSPGARRAIVGGTVVFISGFLLAKMVALSVLFVGSHSRYVWKVVPQVFNKQIITSNHDTKLHPQIKPSVL